MVLSYSFLGRDSYFYIIFSEYNPASIKFKIQLAAYYHIPEIKLLRQPHKDALVPGKSIEFVLKITNPTQHATFIEILDLVRLNVTSHPLDWPALYYF